MSEDNKLKVMGALTRRVTQEELADILGVSQPAVSKLIADGVIPRDATAGEQLLAYSANLRYQVAKRLGATMALTDLPKRFQS